MLMNRTIQLALNKVSPTPHSLRLTPSVDKPAPETLELSIALTIATVARGNWNLLDDLGTMEPNGVWHSDFSWLRDGSVIAPLTYFLPTRTVQL